MATNDKIKELKVSFYGAVASLALSALWWTLFHNGFILLVILNVLMIGFLLTDLWIVIEDRIGWWKKVKKEIKEMTQAEEIV